MSCRFATEPPVTSAVACMRFTYLDSTAAMPRPSGSSTPPVPPVAMERFCAWAVNASAVTKSATRREKTFMDLLLYKNYAAILLRPAEQPFLHVGRYRAFAEPEPQEGGEEVIAGNLLPLLCAVDEERGSGARREVEHDRRAFLRLTDALD